MDGREATSCIREMGLKLPIIALTAAAAEDGKNTMIRAGATEFATKPILRSILYDKCCKYLAHGRCASDHKSLIGLKDLEVQSYFPA